MLMIDSRASDSKATESVTRKAISLREKMREPPMMASMATCCLFTIVKLKFGIKSFHRRCHQDASRISADLARHNLLVGARFLKRFHWTKATSKPSRAWSGKEDAPRGSRISIPMASTHPSITARPEIVVQPTSTDQVSRVVRLANERQIPILARGGGTGLCGSAVPLRRGHRPGHDQDERHQGDQGRGPLSASARQEWSTTSSWRPWPPSSSPFPPRQEAARPAPSAA